MAGRKAGFRHSNDTRKKIKAKQIINRLTNHLMDEKGLLSASQVNAAKVLLNKVLPDLKGVELKGELEHRSIEQFSTAELLADIAREEERSRAENPITSKPDPVH